MPAFRAENAENAHERGLSDQDLGVELEVYCRKCRAKGSRCCLWVCAAALLVRCAGWLVVVCNECIA